MTPRSFILSLLAATGACAWSCTQSTFSAILGSTAVVDFAYPLPANSTFQVPAADTGFPSNPEGLPALCAIGVQVPQPNNGTYGFGLFLPENWNGRFLAVGNSGFAGGVNWADMGVGTQYGFAALSSDLGHNSTAFDGSWAYQQPQKLVAWGYAALHGSVVLGKEVVRAYYGRDYSYAYYSGCSTGGRQGFKEIEMFPDDFDGVLAGAPAWWTIRLQTWSVVVGLYNLPLNASYSIPQSMFDVIADEVVRQCDPQDGVVDSIISDPRRCDFRIEALLCGSPDVNASACLVPDQLDTLYKIYNDWVEANQTFEFPHLELGSEQQWSVLIGDEGDTPNPIGTDYVKYFLGYGPEWTWEDWNPSIATVSDQMNPGNATVLDFDFTPFYKSGRKVLHYHGWADGLIATGSSRYLYDHILRAMQPQGIDLDDFYRFFLVPGMQHCAGTPTNVNAPWYFAGSGQAEVLSPSMHSVPGFEDPQHDILLALMDWVENGNAPSQIIATKWVNDSTYDRVWRQRPICKFPLQAHYVGGDMDKAENWRCESLYLSSQN